MGRRGTTLYTSESRRGSFCHSRLWGRGPLLARVPMLHVSFRQVNKDISSRKNRLRHLILDLHLHVSVPRPTGNRHNLGTVQKASVDASALAVLTAESHIHVLQEPRFMPSPRPCAAARLRFAKSRKSRQSCSAHSWKYVCLGLSMSMSFVLEFQPM